MIAFIISIVFLVEMIFYNILTIKVQRVIKLLFSYILHFLAKINISNCLYYILLQITISVVFRIIKFGVFCPLIFIVLIVNMGLIRRVYHFYLDGFRNMSSWGRTLWVIILIKLFIMFAVLRLFFFRDTLKNKYTSDEERANHVIEELINR